MELCRDVDVQSQLLDFMSVFVHLKKQPGWRCNHEIMEGFCQVWGYCCFVGYWLQPRGHGGGLPGMGLPLFCWAIAATMRSWRGSSRYEVTAELIVCYFFSCALWVALCCEMGVLFSCAL